MSGVLSAAAASGSELSTVSTIVADAITGFGLAASDSTRVADLLTQAANTGTIDIEDLGESFKYVAPLCSAMGFSIEDATTALAAMSTAGIKGSQAGTSLRTAFLNMASPTDAVAAAMDKIGLTVTDANGNFKDMDTILSEMRSGMEGMTESEKENVIATIAGKNAVSGLMSVVNMSQEDYDALAASMDNCSGIAEETAAVMQDNLQSKIEQLGGALESLAIKLADYVIPFLTSLVEKITSAVEWFTNLDPTIQKVILVIGGIVAVAGPLLIIIGKVVSAVGTIMTIVPKVAGVIKTVQTAFAALNATMLANPIVLIIAAIAALVAAFIYLWNTNEDFRQFWIDLWENIKEVAVTVWNAIKDFFVAAWEAISTAAQTVWNALKDFFSGLWDGIKNVFTTAVNAISSFLSTAWNAISTTAQTIWNAISSFFSTVWNGIKSIVTTVVNAIKIFLTTAWNTIKTTISTVLNAIKTVFTTIWNGIKSVVTSVVNGIISTISSVWNGIKSTISSVMNTIKNTVGNVFKNIWNSIKNTMGSIVSTIKDGFNKAITFITSLPSKALQWGKDIIMGIVNGIKSCISAVGDAVSSVADKITSFLHFSVPDEGPLTDYESWMPDFMAGLAKGIEDSKGMIAKAMDGVASDMVISPSLSAATESGEYSSSSESTAGIISAIQTAFAELQTNGGDTVIPVYIGGTMLDEIVVNAQQRVNLRSGGR